MDKTSQREIILLTFLFIIYSNAKEEYMKNIVFIQIIVHSLLITKILHSCNPVQGPSWCNSFALLFGFIYLYKSIIDKNILLGFVALFIIISHLILIDFFNIKKVTKKNISIVTLNYMRPHNIIKQINSIQEYDVVKEIIICHGNPENKKIAVDGIVDKYNKIIHLDHDNTLGGAVRYFIASKHCKYEYILFLDDDVIPSYRLLLDLSNQADQHLLVGPIPRQCNKNVGSNSSFIYTLFNQILQINFSSHDILLTPILLIKNNVLQSLMPYIERLKPFYKKHRGNGEDISINKLFTQVYKRKPKLVYGNYTWLDYKSHSYHTKDDFHQVRNQLCKS